MNKFVVIIAILLPFGNSWANSGGNLTFSIGCNGMVKKIVGRYKDFPINVRFKFIPEKKHTVIRFTSLVEREYFRQFIEHGLRYGMKSACARFNVNCKPVSICRT